MSATVSFIPLDPENPPGWARRTATPLDFAVIHQDAGPHLAFTQLALRPASTHYLHTLEKTGDIRGRWRERTPGYHFAERHFTIHGWTRHPEAAGLARQDMNRHVAAFLPDRTGRHELGEDLGTVFAQVASGLDRIRLRFILRAERGVGKVQFHEDDGIDYSAGAYLCNSGTVHAAPGSWRPGARRLHRLGYSDSPVVHYEADAQMMQQARQLPGRTVAVWPERAPHTAPAQTGHFRLALFAFADNHARASAPARLGWHHRLLRLVAA